jgi:hypothetical protein
MRERRCWRRYGTEAKIVWRRAGPILVVVDGGRARLEVGGGGVGMEEVVKLLEGVAAGVAAGMSLENSLSISDPIPLTAATRGRVTHVISLRDSCSARSYRRASVPPRPQRQQRTRRQRLGRSDRVWRRCPCSPRLFRFFALSLICFPLFHTPQAL